MKNRQFLFGRRSTDPMGPRHAIFSKALVVLLALILVILAALQYRWSGQVSRAEHERMQTSLLASMGQFRLQFRSRFQQLAVLLQPDPTTLGKKDWKGYAAKCGTLLEGPEYHLICNIYLWVGGPQAGSRLLKLNKNLKTFEPWSWSPDLEGAKERFEEILSEWVRPVPEPWRSLWTMVGRRPILLHPLVTSQLISGSPTESHQLVGWLVIEPNIEAIRGGLFPELAREYFAGPDGFVYNVAIAHGHDPVEVIFRSDPTMEVTAFARSDARIRLFDTDPTPIGPGVPTPVRLGWSDRLGTLPLVGPLTQGEKARVLPTFPDGGDLDWELIASHREGSLESALAGLRKRNLAISFGGLLLLAVSMAFIIVFGRRAERFTKLQIRFVAGVSHELRTPLAVICSAADNLAEGVVADSSGPVRRYGELIRNEGRRLTEMVEQILLFASLHTSRRYRLTPARIEEITNAALDQARQMIEAAGFSVEKYFSPDLPMVNVDAAALTQAIQNLIQNAVKYSGDSRWLAIRTAKVRAKSHSEVQLTIEDKGMGIETEDLQHIFEAFYRGRTASASQMHGAGLGLFMVREALAAMGGSISAKSTPGKGSAFTIHLPALPGDSE